MARVSKALCLFAVLAILGQATALTCVFLHGWGSSGPKKPSNNKAIDPNYVQSTNTILWGDMNKRAGGICDRSVFYWTDTNSRGWQNPALQAEYCNVIKAQAADVIFAHSMGNMILSAGIAARLPGCDTIGREPGQRHWYNIMGPMRGSEAAVAGAAVCRATGPLGSLAKALCKPKKGFPLLSVPSDSLLSLLPAKCPASLATVAAQTASGNLCGVRTNHDGVKTNGIATGLQQKGEALAFGAVRAIVSLAFRGNKDWATKNKPNPTVVPQYGVDGVVPFSSCRIAPQEAYTRSPASAYYALSGAHADGVCRSGDAVDAAKYPDFQPCTWMLNMARNSKKIKSAVGVAMDYPTTPEPLQVNGGGVISAARFAEVDLLDAQEAEEEAEEAMEIDSQDESEDESAEESDAESESEDESEAETDAEMAMDVEAEAEANAHSHSETDAEAELETEQEMEDEMEFEAEAEAEAEVEMGTAMEVDVTTLAD